MTVERFWAKVKRGAPARCWEWQAMRHLFLGTKAENNRDRASKSRSADSRGEKHNAARLTAAKVRRARKDVAAGATCTEVAAAMGVSLSCVWDACNGRSWRHI